VLLVDLVATFAVRRFLNAVAELSEEEGVRKCERLINTIVRFVPRWHPTAIRNLELVFPEMSATEREELARRSYRVLGWNLFWFAKVGVMSADEVKSLFDYSDAQPIFDRLKVKKTGALFITSHFGLFELMAQAQSLHGRPYAILNREFGFPRLDKLWRERRERFGSKVFDRKGGYKEMMTRIAAGQDVAVLFDQNVKEKHAIFVDLFGKKAATTKAIAYTALKNDCSVIFAVCLENPLERREHGRFRIHAREIPNPNAESGTTEEKIEKFLRRLHIELEGVIREWPEGWFWIHRRWKTRPKSEQGNFYD